MAYALVDVELKKCYYSEDCMSLGNTVRPLSKKIVLHPSSVFKNICGQPLLNRSTCLN